MPQDNHTRRANAFVDEAMRAVRRSIRGNSEIEEETRKKIAASRKLLDATAKMIEIYKPTKI
jgi:hypothetical protein